MHKTTNHVFSQFIRLQPWAFSLSLAGLMALGSCAPPATQKPPMLTAPSSSPIWLDNVPNLKPPTPQTNQNLHFGLGDFKIQGYPLCGNTPEEAQASYGGANACYSAGGSPLWSQQETGNLDWFGRPEICITFNKCEFPVGGGGSSENDPNNGCDPKGQNCETDLPDFFLLAHHGNRPLNRAAAPGDSPTQQVTLSPEDVNDAFDWTRLTIRDNQSQGWQLQISNANGKLLKEESGTGSTFVEWDGSNPAGEKVANGIYTARLTSPALPGTQIERMIRIDNNPPLVSNIRVQENPSTGFFSVKAKLKEAGNGAFQSGINPDTIQIFFDYFSTDQGFGKSYDAATGEYSVQFSNLAQYQQAKQLSQQSGYDFPFELRVSDFAGNETSNRGSGPDGPLRIQVTDPYFSPNADGVKDNLNFKVIAETSEPYLVAIKRNGIAVKTWTGLTGEQNLSWNGNFMFTDRLQADGSYRIVAMTERQKDRVRDAQMVVLDNTAPSLRKADIVKKSGQGLITASLYDTGSKIDWNSPQFSFSEAVSGITTSFPEKQTTDHNLGSVDNVFLERLRSGQVQVRLRVSDRAGNVLDTPLDDFGVKITLSSVEFLEDRIVLKGKVKDPEQNFDIYSLKADFFDDVVVLKQEVVSATASGEFTIEVTEWEFTDALQTKVDNSPSEQDEYPVSARVSTVPSDFRTQSNTDTPLVSNLKKGNLPVLGFESEVSYSEINEDGSIDSEFPTENMTNFSISSLSGKNTFTIGTGKGIRLNYSFTPKRPVPPDQNVIVSGDRFLANRQSNDKQISHHFTIRADEFKTKPKGPFHFSFDWYGRKEYLANNQYGKFGPFLVQNGGYYLGAQYSQTIIPLNPKKPILISNNEPNFKPPIDQDLHVFNAQARYRLHVPKAWPENQTKHMYERHVMDYLSQAQYEKWAIGMNNFNANANLALKKYNVAQKHKAAAIKFTNMGDLVKAKERHNSYLADLDDSATTLTNASQTLRGDLFNKDGNYKKTTRSPKGSVFFSNEFSPEDLSQSAEEVANLSLRTDYLPTDPQAQFVNIKGWRNGWLINAFVRLDNNSIDTAYPIAGAILEDQALINYYTQKAGANLPFMNLSYNGNPEVFFTPQVVSFMQNFRLNPEAPGLMGLVK